MKRPDEIEYYRGFNPVLLLFAPERSHPAYVAAREQLRQVQDELNAWELQIFTVFSSGQVFHGSERLPKADVAAFRRDFGAHREQFTAVLLDVNGNEQLRQHREFDLREIFDQLRLLRAVASIPVQQPRQASARRARR